jgi:beta-lactamase regulating signal transducer with metallopeptidase domain
MNTLALWISPSTLHSLGWALLHFLWQGTAVAALAAVLMALCRRSTTRYGLAVGALLLMLAAPVGTYLFLRHSGDTSFVGSYPSGKSQWPASQTVGAATSSRIRGISPSLDTSPWLVEVWLLGVAFFSLRSAGGFLLLESKRRKHSNNVNERLLGICHALQHRMGLERTIRYCECQWLQAPAVIGWFRPVVLLPLTALTGLSEDQLRSIIAHELAHIQRFDAFVNAFQIAVETLLFYHPAVWWLNRRIRVEREHCCDDAAVSLCGNPVEYARALTLMEEWRSAPVLAMAANRGPLSDRIFRVLGLKSMRSGIRGIGLAGGILCLSGALAAGNILLKLAYPTVHAGAASIAHSSLGYFGVADFSWQSPATPAAAPSPVAKPSAAARPQSQPVPSGSYIENMKAAGLGEVTVDQLIALKIQDVTPEYVRGVHEQGLHPDADELVAMKIQGVTPDYVRELHQKGLQPDADQLVSMRIQGVTPDYVRDIQALGLKADVDQLVSMRIQSVTPDYVRGIQALGLKPDVDQLVSMRIQNVTPDYVRDIQALGLKPDVDQLVSMRIQSVAPDFVRDIQALGLKPDVDEFISMRIQGVTPDYVKGLQAAGFKFTVDEVIRAKIQNITQDFIQRAVKHGFQNLTLDKLIQLKNLGVLDSRADL